MVATTVLPIGSWCYRMKISHLRLTLSLNLRMMSFFNFVFPKKTSIKKQLSYTESTIDSFESSSVEPRKDTRMRKATSFGDDFYVFLVENDPQTFTQAMTSRMHHYGKKLLIVN